MKRNKPARIVSVLLLGILWAGLLLTGSCAQEKRLAGPDPIQVRQIPEGLKGDLNPVVEANTAFALALYRQVKGQEGNLFLSPYSISTALAMTWGGARNETEQGMAQALHFALPQERIHPIFGALQRSLEAGASLGGYRLAIANRLWGRLGFPWLPSFLDLTRSSYEAELQSLDFGSDPEACRRTINEWVAGQTAGRIEELLPAGIIDRDTRLVLTNAIYFKGRWEFRFDPAQTRNDDFTLSPGATIPAPTMHQEAEFAFGARDGLSVLVLPYTGEDLSMVFLLPETADGLPDLEEQLTPENLASWTAPLHKIKLPVAIPRFRTTSTFELKPPLVALGMGAAFDPAVSDFSGMDGRQDLVIDAVVHKGFVEVNEEGTEAAGATGVIVGPTSIPTSFVANHPFLFLIRDEVTGSILFLGRIVDPR